MTEKPSRKLLLGVVFATLSLAVIFLILTQLKLVWILRALAALFWIVVSGTLLFYRTKVQFAFAHEVLRWISRKKSSKMNKLDPPTKGRKKLSIQELVDKDNERV